MTPITRFWLLGVPLLYVFHFLIIGLFALYLYGHFEPVGTYALRTRLVFALINTILSCEAVLKIYKRCLNLK